MTDSIKKIMELEDVEERILALLETVKTCIAAGTEDNLRAVFAEMHEADIAGLFNLVDPHEIDVLFDLIPREMAPSVLSHLEEHAQETVVRQLSKERLADILENMDDDDAADILGNMERADALKILALIDTEDRKDLEDLLKYEEDSAGGIMTGEFVALRGSMTVAQAIEALRGREDLERINVIFVIDKEEHLLGQIHVRDLLFKKPHARLGEFIDEEVISVPVDMDQEEVARIVAHYDLLAVPVIDKEKKIVGRVTVDDIIDVIREEADEDLYKMAGTSEEELWTKSIFRIALIRVPWLFVTLFGGMVAAFVIGRFETTLSRAIALAFFTPVVMGMSGTVGIQSMTIVIKRLSMGSLSFKQLPRLLFREFLTGLLMGIMTGVILGLISHVWFQSIGFGIILGVSLLTAISISACVGTFVPMILDRLDVDTAVATNPFITTTSDILSAAVYLSIATLLLNWI